MKTIVPNPTFIACKPAAGRRLSHWPVTKAALTLLATFAFLLGVAQTYTTKAAGNWSNAATWVGGVVPSTSVSSTMVVNINHAVTYDSNSDLQVNGTVAIYGDTLRFPTSYAGKVTVSSTGLLSVKNGGFVQDVSTHKNSLTVSSGRTVFDKARVVISKGFLSSGTAVRYINKSTVQVGQSFTLTGAANQMAIDTVQNSTIEVSMSENGDFTVDWAVLNVAGATVRVYNNNTFINRDTVQST